MNQYEYTTLILSGKETDDFGDRLTDRLNQLGKEGWKLVSSFMTPALGNSQYALIGITHRLSLIFMRKSKSGEEECK